MPRTPALRAVMPQLKALNDQLWFHLLMEHEFVERLGNFSARIGDLLTTDLFVRNPAAPRIRVKIAKLPSFRDTHRGFTFAAHFSTSYEFASTYFDHALRILGLASVKPVTKPARGNDSPETYYTRVLAASGLAPAPGDELATLSYCRLRRNAFIHLDTTASAAYRTLASTRGIALNIRWAGQRRGLDFTVPSIGTMTQQEAVTLLQLMRVCIEELDAHLLSLLSVEGLAILASARMERAPRRMHKEIIDQRTAVLRKLTKSEFGIDPGDAVARRVVRST